MIAADSFLPVVRRAFGVHRGLLAAERLDGGSKKGVYRLTLDDQFTVIVYVWDASENYWPAERLQEADLCLDPLSDAAGADLFEAAHGTLRRIGIRIPDLYWLDTRRADYPGEVAVVEDLCAGTLESHWMTHPGAAASATRELGDMLDRMHAHTSNRFGKIGFIDEPRPHDQTCVGIVLQRALDNLEKASHRLCRLRDVRAELEMSLRDLASKVQPRGTHALIHGELGPDHVMLDARGQPVLIDFEGLMFFDVEWEHAFLDLRFGEGHKPVRNDEVDVARQRFYKLALYLSLCAGPLRLLRRRLSGSKRHGRHHRGQPRASNGFRQTAGLIIRARLPPGDAS